MILFLEMGSGIENLTMKEMIFFETVITHNPRQNVAQEEEKPIHVAGRHAARACTWLTKATWCSQTLCQTHLDPHLESALDPNLQLERPLSPDHHSFTRQLRVTHSTEDHSFHSTEEYHPHSWKRLIEIFGPCTNIKKKCYFTPQNISPFSTPQNSRDQIC